MKNSEIKLVKSTFYNEDKVKNELAQFIQSSNSLSMGEYCALFEAEFSRYQGRKYSRYVSSGSSANLVLIQALLNLGRLKSGDVVGVSALTWPTNVMPLIQLGLVPVLLDVDLGTLNVSSAALVKSHASNERLKCVFLTNALGFCADLKEITSYCNGADILLLEDNCESLGSSADRKLGNYGLASTFSFFVGHHLSTIEGGMICTDDEELGYMCSMVRAHGWLRNLDEPRQKELKEKHSFDDFESKYKFFDLAFNCRNNEIGGFIGMLQLACLDEIISQRHSNFLAFQEATSKNPKINLLNVSHMKVVSNFAFPLVFDDVSTYEKYKERFLAEQVEIRPIIGGSISNQPFWAKYFEPQICENADFIEKHGFYFPNNPELTNVEVARLIALVEGVS